MDGYDIVGSFKRIEDELIASMIRNLDRHRAEEDKLGINWEQWQVLQLKALEDYKRNNQKTYGETFDSINNRIAELIRLQREAGNAEQEEEVLEAIKQGAKLGRGIGSTPQAGATFFRMNDRRMDALIKATTDDMEKAEYAMLRMSDDKYRQIIYDAQVYAASGAGTYQKAVDMATKDFLRAGINCIEYANGSRHTIADYADMVIRTTGKRSKLAGEGEVRAKWGISTVIVHKRGNPCPKCLPFCGKILIDDVWSGGSSKDGPYPLMSHAIAAGLYHPRCKDGHSTYFEGISTPPDDTFSREELEEIEKNSRQEARQQYAKRQAESYGRMAKYSLDKDNKHTYSVSEKEWSRLAAKAENSYEGVPEHKTPEYLGTLDDLSVEMVKSALREYEREIADSDIENAVIITKEGHVWRCYGDKNNVYPNVDLGRKALEGAWVTHNHPADSENEYSFSKYDINLFMESGLEVLRGIDERFIYELSRNAKELDAHVPLGDWDEFEAWHDRIISTAEKLKIGYRRWRRD